MKVYLDIHYSDFWADPQHQDTPAAWAGQDLPTLANTVRSYTSDTLSAFARQHTPVSMVSIGNEIRNGMLWPTGQLDWTADTGWDNLATLLKAGAAGARAANPAGNPLRVMLHFDEGGNAADSARFYGNLVSRGVPFDVIGLSYYPFWHGSPSDLRANVDSLATRFGKDIVIAETQYAWTLANGDSTGNFVWQASQLSRRVPGQPGWPAVADERPAVDPRCRPRWARRRTLLLGTRVGARRRLGAGRGRAERQPDPVRLPGPGAAVDRLPAGSRAGLPALRRVRSAVRRTRRLASPRPISEAAPRRTRPAGPMLCSHCVHFGGRKRMSRRLTAAAVAAATVLGGSFAAAAGAAATTSAGTTARAARSAVPDSRPAWTAHARHLGHAAAAQAVHARVYLAPRGGLAAVRRTAQAVSDPSSEQYRKFLTPEQYHARFGTTDATVRAVGAYLRSAGLHVGAVGPQNRYLVVSGTVRSAEKAFGARVDRYTRAGKTVQAPTGALSVPSTLASAVLSISGLDTSASKVRPASNNPLKEPPGFRAGQPCSQYFGQLKATYEADGTTRLPKFDGRRLSYAPCGYVGPQLRQAYEGTTSLDGAGITVGITDAFASPSIKQDARTYAARHGDAAYGPGQFVQTSGAPYQQGLDDSLGEPCGSPVGWYGEETLDVEAVHAMAPAAKIHYYASSNCDDSGFIDDFGRIVEADDVQIVTNSWGDLEAAEGEGVIAAYDSLFLQGAAEGISFTFSSGDDGDEAASSGTKQTEYPTSDPYVTSVGGTSTAIGKSDNLLFQAGWGTESYGLAQHAWSPQGFVYGAGGGTSGLFARPDYQDGVTTSAHRQVPDVAMDADPNTGMLVGERQTFSDGTYYDEYRIGGTSLASPLFAGMTALRMQAAGGGLGLLNPTIYAEPGRFTDVTPDPPQPGVVRANYVNSENADAGISYVVRTFGHDSSLPVTRGYDLVTGLGTPNRSWLTAG